MLWQFEHMEIYKEGKEKVRKALVGKGLSSHTNPSKFKQQIEFPLFRYKHERLHAS